MRITQNRYAKGNTSTISHSSFRNLKFIRFSYFEHPHQYDNLSLNCELEKIYRYKTTVIKKVLLYPHKTVEKQYHLLCKDTVLDIIHNN